MKIRDDGSGNGARLHDTFRKGDKGFGREKRQVLKVSSGSGKPGGHKLHPGNSEGPGTSVSWERRHQTSELRERSGHF